MTRPLRIGMQLPIIESSDGSDRIEPRWSEILALAQLAEEVGIDSVWVPDHLLFRRAGDDGVTQGAWECWSLVAALAAATERITIGTLVSPTAFRDPRLLAEMARTVAAISGGRLILGVGAGWHEPEFRAFGIPFDRRVSRFEAALLTLTQTLRADPNLSPIPIMIGSTGARMLNLTARHADLWNVGLVSGSNLPEVLPPILARVDAACIAAGRDPSTLGRTVNLLVTLPLPGATPTPPGDQPIQGSIAEIAATLQGFAALGVSHLQLLLNPTTLEAVEWLRAVLRQFDVPRDEVTRD